MSDEPNFNSQCSPLQRIVLNAAKRALTDLINGKCDRSELKALGKKYADEEFKEMLKSGRPLL